MQFDQFRVDAVEEIIVFVQYKGETTGHAGTEVVPGATQHGDGTAGHVFTAVIASAFHHGVGAGVTYPEALASGTRSHQLAAGSTVQTGVTDNGRFLALERAAIGRTNHQLATGHALAHVIVGITFDVHVQATGVEHTEALPGGTGEAHLDRRAVHVQVAVTLGDFAGHPGPHGTITVSDLVVEGAAGLAVDGRQHVLNHFLVQHRLVERLIAADLAVGRLVCGHQIIAQDRRQIQLALTHGFAFQHFQQVGAADQLGNALHTQQRQ